MESDALLSRNGPFDLGVPTERGREMDDFRSSALRGILWFLPLGSLGVAWVFTTDFANTPFTLGLLVPELLLLTIAGLVVLDRKLRLATALTIAGLLLVVTTAVLARPDSLFAVLFALVVLVASATGGPLTGFATAGFAVALIGLFRLELAPAFGAEVALTAAFVSIATAVLSWLATSPVYVALDWSWRSHASTRRAIEDLRDRQSELGRVVKSLNEAYLQLEIMNGELSRAREAADEARRHKAEFAANISHELRTPLNLIIGFSEMMVLSLRTYEGERLPPVHQGDMEAIYRNACHLSNLVDDVLDLSQVDAHRMALRRERAELAPIVAEAVNTVGALFSDKHLSLDTALPPDLPLLNVDRVRVRQIIINLLANAARFTVQGGVTISAQRDGTDIRVSIADTGVGIPPDDIARVFDEFHQSIGSGTGGARLGSGLGLTICKRFVELHGGAMWLDSEVGRGSTFHFTLPTVYSADVTTGREVRPRVSGEASPTVLVVDEQPDTIRLFERYLDGYRVVAADGLAEATHLAPRIRPRAIVVSSDSIDGVDAASPAFRWDGPIIHCPIRTHHDFAEQLGAAGYLAKPISRQQLRAVLAKAGKPPLTVLVVDDDPDTVRLLTRMIGSVSKRHRIIQTPGGAVALEALATETPDLILLDLLMPDVDGYTVLSALQREERLANVPVVIITAKGREEEMVIAKSLKVTRAGGLSVGETMRCLRASLDALSPWDSDAPASPKGPTG